MNTQQINKVIADSRPINDEDYHSDRHIKALTSLYDLLERFLPEDLFNQWFEYSERATAEESADFALQLIDKRKTA